MFLGLLSYWEGGTAGGGPPPPPPPTPAPVPIEITAGRGITSDHAFLLRRQETEEAIFAAIAAFLHSIE